MFINKANKIQKPNYVMVGICTKTIFYNFLLVKKQNRILQKLPVIIHKTKPKLQL